MGKRLYSEKRETFRALLKQTRIDAELTQIQLAALLERPQSYVSDYESGQRRLDWVAVEDVLIACGSNLVSFARGYAALTRSD